MPQIRHNHDNPSLSCHECLSWILLTERYYIYDNAGASEDHIVCFRCQDNNPDQITAHTTLSIED